MKKSSTKLQGPKCKKSASKTSQKSNPCKKCSSTSEKKNPCKKETSSTSCKKVVSPCKKTSSTSVKRSPCLKLYKKAQDENKAAFCKNVRKTSRKCSPCKKSSSSSVKRNPCRELYLKAQKNFKPKCRPTKKQSTSSCKCKKIDPCKQTSSTSCKSKKSAKKKSRTKIQGPVCKQSSSAKKSSSCTSQKMNPCKALYKKKKSACKKSSSSTSQKTNPCKVLYDKARSRSKCKKASSTSCRSKSKTSTCKMSTQRINHCKAVFLEAQSKNKTSSCKYGSKTTELKGPVCNESGPEESSSSTSQKKNPCQVLYEKARSRSCKKSPSCTSQKTNACKSTSSKSDPCKKTTEKSSKGSMKRAKIIGPVCTKVKSAATSTKKSQIISKISKPKLLDKFFKCKQADKPTKTASTSKIKSENISHNKKSASKIIAPKCEKTQHEKSSRSDPCKKCSGDSIKKSVSCLSGEKKNLSTAPNFHQESSKTCQVLFKRKSLTNTRSFEKSVKRDLPSRNCNPLKITSSYDSKKRNFCKKISSCRKTNIKKRSVKCVRKALPSRKSSKRSHSCKKLPKKTCNPLKRRKTKNACQALNEKSQKSCKKKRSKSVCRGTKSKNVKKWLLHETPSRKANLPSPSCKKSQDATEKPKFLVPGSAPTCSVIQIGKSPSKKKESTIIIPCKIKEKKATILAAPKEKKAKKSPSESKSKVRLKITKEGKRCYPSMKITTPKKPKPSSNLEAMTESPAAKFHKLKLAKSSSIMSSREHVYRIKTPYKPPRIHKVKKYQFTFLGPKIQDNFNATCCRKHKILKFPKKNPIVCNDTSSCKKAKKMIVDDDYLCRVEELIQVKQCISHHVSNKIPKIEKSDECPTYLQILETLQKHDGKMDRPSRSKNRCSSRTRKRSVSRNRKSIPTPGFRDCTN